MKQIKIVDISDIEKTLETHKAFEKTVNKKIKKLEDDCNDVESLKYLTDSNGNLTRVVIEYDDGR